MEKLLIGENLIIDNPVVLGPMAGVTDMAFRSLCVEQGAGLVYTEMVSAKGLTYHNRNTKDLLRTADTEKNVAVQLFGHEPDVMHEATLMIEDYPFCAVDINMGCPVPKVVNNHEGSAMMLDPAGAAAVVKAVKRATKKPVTVKFRKGFKEGEELGVDFARAMEAAGADAITIHGRTRAQGYSGIADWDYIRKVKQAVNVPVIGSGDVFQFDDIKKMYDETGVDGVMIARGARGNPWIFNGYKPTWDEIKEMIIRHAMLLTDQDGEYAAIRKMRSHTAWYTAGQKNSAKLRNALSLVETLEELKNVLEQ